MIHAREDSLGAWLDYGDGREGGVEEGGEGGSGGNVREEEEEVQDGRLEQRRKGNRDGRKGFTEEGREREVVQRDS